MKTTYKTNRHRLSLLAFCLIPVSLGATFIMMDSAEPHVQIIPDIPPPPVSIVHATVKPWQAEIQVNGVVEALNQVALTSEVSGRIFKLSDNFQEGSYVKANEALAYVEPLRSQRNLATAKQALADAKVNYLKEERKTRQAKLDWDRLRKGKTPGSSLVLNQPQLKAARARLKATTADVKFAQSQLDKTVLRSPFPAIIMKRTLNLGQVITDGTEIATLQERGKSRVRFEVSEKKWQLLNKSLRQSLAQGQKSHLEMTFHDPLMPDTIWKSQTVRMAGQKNTQTRQRRLIADLTAPDLLPGTFVTIHFQGSQVSNVLAVPISAVSVDGYFWTVDHKNRLTRHNASVLSMNNGQAYIQAPSTENTYRVVISPLVSMLVGQEIQPNIVKKNNVQIKVTS